jgi:hypothetical protein
MLCCFSSASSLSADRLAAWRGLGTAAQIVPSFPKSCGLWRGFTHAEKEVDDHKNLSGKEATFFFLFSYYEALLAISAFKKLLQETGVYILENTPPPGGGE